jgi:glycosyltransferase involved in cell wall biosynthesis
MTRDPDPSRQLKVVFVDHVARMSGGEIALLRLLPALAAHVRVHVILGEHGPLVDRLMARGIETEVLPLHPALRDVRKDTIRPGHVDLAAVARLPRYVARLSRRIKALDADLVHTNSLKAAMYGGAAARLAGVPAVWHIRDRIAPDYLPRSAVALVRAASRVLPSAVIANSQATLATVPTRRQGQVLYNPVVPDSVGEFSRMRMGGPGVITVGVLGRLSPWKGQHVFIDAFAEAFGGTDARGHVIGSAMFGEEAYEQSLRRQVEALGLSEQIEFRGFRDDVWAELHELHILVHASVIPEPFGQVVLEGMAAGLPVIASNAGGPAELITNGVDGILTEPGDAHELAAALIRLRDDPELGLSLGAAARLRASEFTPERTAKRLLAVYDETVASR